MKRLICIALAAATLGGCVVAPVGPGYGYGHRPRYVEPPVVVVPSYRGGYGPGYGRDFDRGRGWDNDRDHERGRHGW